MAQKTDIVVILGSGPTALAARDWDREWLDRIVVINNAWQVRDDWDDLIYPFDFPVERRPDHLQPGQRLIEADQFVPTQNAYGGFVYAGGTMAFTAGYWALHALRPRILAFLGCDMIYPNSGPTHFYGNGAADPLRADITLQDLGAKSARLGLMAAAQGCACVNLSTEESQLLFQRARASELRHKQFPLPDPAPVVGLVRDEDQLGYFVPNGRYWDETDRFDSSALAGLDAGWRAAWAQQGQAAAA